MEQSSTKLRLDSIDFVRGLVMVIMALDHVRDFFSNAQFDPTDLARTDGWYFFTRFITHYCAPVFVFLAGTGAFLSSKRRDPGALSRFLLTRGIWLVIIELTIIRFGWFFNLTYAVSVGQVIWAIGWSMVALSLISRLPVKAVAAVGIGIILLHNTLDSVHPTTFGPAGWLWNILHEPGFIQLFPNHSIFYLYPLLPWIGVMSAGFAFGAIYTLPQERRRSILLILGIVMTLGFVVLRWLNIYGDPSPWTTQPNAFFSVLSFINVTKYPPSLLYVLITLGPVMFLLRALDGKEITVAKPLITFGRVPMFYYITHIYLIHGLAFLAAFIHTNNPWYFTSDAVLAQPMAERGFPLWVVYLVWLGVVVALYPLCKWYAGVKRRDTSGWLSYL